MSMMQGLRDGYRIDWRRRFYQAWLGLRIGAAIGLWIFAIVEYHTGDIQRATFDAVLAIGLTNWVSKA